MVEFGGLEATSYCLVPLTATQVTFSLLANHRYSTFGEFAMGGTDEAGHPVRERLTESTPHVSGNRNVPRASEGLTLRRSPVRFRRGDGRGGGENHFEADHALADQVLQAAPHSRTEALENRQFPGPVVGPAGHPHPPGRLEGTGHGVRSRSTASALRLPAHPSYLESG